MKVASSGSVDGTRVVMLVDPYGDIASDEGLALVAVVEAAVSFSFNSAARRTISLACTMRASKSCKASLRCESLPWAEDSTVLRIPPAQRYKYIVNLSGTQEDVLIPDFVSVVRSFMLLDSELFEAPRDGPSPLTYNYVLELSNKDTCQVLLTSHALLLRQRLRTA